MILASGRRAISHTLKVCVTACLLFFAARAQQPQANKTQYFIDEIRVVGNRSVQTQTIRAHILSRPGDLYNAEAVQRDAQALRETGYFTEVRLRVEDSPYRPNGKIVEFDVIETKALSSAEPARNASKTESNQPATKSVLGDITIEGDIDDRDTVRDRIVEQWTSLFCLDFCSAMRAYVDAAGDHFSPPAR